MNCVVKLDKLEELQLHSLQHVYEYVYVCSVGGVAGGPGTVMVTFHSKRAGLEQATPGL